jgi:hypothetical protein
MKKDKLFKNFLPQLVSLSLKAKGLIDAASLPAELTELRSSIAVIWSASWPALETWKQKRCEIDDQILVSEKRSKICLYKRHPTQK